MVESVDVESVVESPVAAVAACVFPWAVFDVTGAVAATTVVRAEGSTGACALVLTVMTGVETVAFAAACGLPDEVAAPGSVLPWTDGPAGGESGCELAAIAAAARASGAVGPPEDGAVVGALATGVDAEIAAAVGVGAVEALPTCCARMVASTADASLPASLPLDLSPADFDVPDFTVVVVPVVDWLVPLAAAPSLPALAEGLELELDGGLLLAALSELSESSFAAGGGVLLLALALLLGLLALLLGPLGPLLASFAGGALSAAGGGDASTLFCAGGRGGGADAGWLGVFWLTRSPKRSFAGDEL